MAPRRARNPNPGTKRPRKTLDASSTDSDSSSRTPSDSDSDFILDEYESDIEEEEEIEVIIPAPIPAPIRQKAKKSKKKTGPPKKWEIWEKENSKWIDNFEAAAAENPDPEDSPLAPTAVPSPDIILPLLRFQREFLAWALDQEASPVRGGILADEMGMGKTIQAISLILTSHPLIPNSNYNDIPSSSSALPRTGCTLVICPVVAMIQWAGEIEQYTRKGSMRVLMYHGVKRGGVEYNFDDYDVVLTTYSTIEYDHRKYIMPPKERCQWCGRMLYAKRMKIHRKYYCGPDAKLTEKQSKQVRKKKVDEKGWVKRDQRKIKGKRQKPTNCISDEDEQSNEPVGQPLGKSHLHSVQWERIILDEAHFIKDRRSSTTRAVFSLQSLYKWALTGTPLQNRVGELYSLVRFLQFSPYSFYFCKDCDCEVLDYGSTSKCMNCPHSTVRHFCWWNRYITKPMQNGQPDESRRAIILLKNRVLKSMVLRRTKQGRTADLALPPRIVRLRRDSFDEKELDFYTGLYTQSRTEFNTYLVANTLLNNYAHVFDLLTRLRQTCDHPYLVTCGKSAKGFDSSKDNSVKDECGVCHDPPEDLVVASCGHAFCKACVLDYTSSFGKASCPSCSKPLTIDLTTKNNNTSGKICRTAVKGYKHSGILKRIDPNNFKRSTKIDALMEEIRNMVEADGSAKGLVFSQFTTFLDLINFSLTRSGVKCVQLVGTMNLSEREKAIKTFTDDSDCRIFLMSLKAGGVALNLTVASHVFSMDPWWNPAVELQAQDRIHRIGQYKPIKVVRFVIEETIEERILKLQEKKQLVFEGTVGESPEALAKLTVEDLRFLFQA